MEATDLDKFLYKCEICQLGFKRRGMLVNHLAKRYILFYILLYIFLLTQNPMSLILNHKMPTTPRNNWSTTTTFPPTWSSLFLSAVLGLHSLPRKLRSGEGGWEKMFWNLTPNWAIWCLKNLNTNSDHFWRLYFCLSFHANFKYILHY